MQFDIRSFLPSRLFFDKYRLLLLIGLLAVLPACGPSGQQEANAPTAQSEPQQEAPSAVAPDDSADEGYPAAAQDSSPAQESYPPPPPAIPTPQESYPVATLPPATATPSVYPPPTVEEVFSEPRFMLDAPIRAGDTIITGQAIPGMRLAVVDVTYGGGQLGLGTADADGRFSINVQGLVEGNRLGITFGDLEPGLSYADMSIKYYPHRGEGFRNLPNVGIVLDSVLIES